MDLNGNESHNLYKFLKRNSAMFMPKYGKANKIQEHHTKVSLKLFKENSSYVIDSE